MRYTTPCIAFLGLLLLLTNGCKHKPDDRATLSVAVDTKTGDVIYAHGVWWKVLHVSPERLQIDRFTGYRHACAVVVENPEKENQ